MMKGFMGILAALLILAGCSRHGEDTFQEDLERSLAQLNEKCPHVLDSETRIDEIKTNGPLSVFYKYSLIRLSADSVDTLQFRKVMWPGILSNIRISSEMKQLRDHGVTFTYDYFDRSGKRISRFLISPADYQNPKYDEQKPTP